MNKSDEKVTLVPREDVKKAEKDIKQQIQEDMQEIHKDNSVGDKLKDAIGGRKKFGKSENVWKILDFF